MVERPSGHAPGELMDRLSAEFAVRKAVIAAHKCAARQLMTFLHFCH